MLSKRYQMEGWRSGEDNKLGKGKLGREQALWWTLSPEQVALGASAYVVRKSIRSLNNIGSLPEIFV